MSNPPDTVPASEPAEKPAGKAAPWRGRRKVEDAKSRFVAVRCTADQHATLTAKAATAGLSVGAFLRTMALGNAGPRARRRPPLEREAVAQLLGHIGRVGGNVNQLAREMNITGDLPGQAALERAAADIAAIRAELMAALGRDVPETPKPGSLVLPGVRHDH
jgi:hypothetical protein